jgi:hypothetical protein
MSTVVKDLGAVSAYAYAVEKGYTGTEAEFAELMADYAEVGQRAEDAAESALNSKTAAQTATTTATNKASEATTAAQTATTKAGEAQTSAQTASSKASEAIQSASQASGYAQTAETAKTDAQTAKTQAETARDNAVTAKIAAETAQGKAEDAQAAAESVAESIPSDYSQLSEDVSDLKSGLNHYVLSKYTTVNPTNWLNLDAVTNGYKVKADGTIEEKSASCYTDYIPVSDGDKVGLFNGSNFSKLYRSAICLYNADKQVVSGGSNSANNNAFTVPSGVSFVRVSMSAQNLASSVKAMLTLDGVTPTAYSAYFEPYEVLSEDFLTEETAEAIEPLVNGTLARSDLMSRYACAMPRQRFRMTLELEQDWYIESAISPLGYLVCGFGGAGNAKRYESKVEFTKDTAGSASNGYTFAMCDESFGKKIRSDVDYAPQGYGLGMTWVAENLADCSLLAIGDSTVDYDTMTAKILSHFAEHDHTITLLGTLGDESVDNHNEGRAGWTAKDYLTAKTYKGVANPFYNPASETFDFSYYMTNQGYNGVDFVVLQVGINDLYNIGYGGVLTAITSTWEALKTMIDSILAYNTSTKIIINLPTTPNNDWTKHSNYLPLYKNTIVKYNDYVQEQLLAYSVNRVRCSYCHLILDANTDISDNVHPNAGGFTKMALEIINQINCWQNG